MSRYLLQPLTWFVTRRYLYHLDKTAHTALLAIALAALSALVHRPVSLTGCAIWTAAIYVVVGKVIWYTSASYRRQVERTSPTKVVRANGSFVEDGLKPGDKIDYLHSGLKSTVRLVSVTATELHMRPTWSAYLPRPSLDWLSDTALSWAVVQLAAMYEGHWRLALVSLLLFPTVYVYAVVTRRTSP